jgi:xanthine/uracil permease
VDSIKEWLLEVGAKKLLPSLIKGAIAALVGLVLAHKGVLDAIGVSYDAPGRTIDINLDTLTIWLVTVGTGLVTALFTALQHHTTAAVTGQPQDGAHQRATDPPKEIK